MLFINFPMEQIYNVFLYLSFLLNQNYDSEMFKKGKKEMKKNQSV